MNGVKGCEKIPAHLPKRLTISFPIWGLYDTEHGGAYRDAGLWGTIVRTCSGPEDPSRNLCPEKLLRMNKIFLGECDA